MGRFYANTTSFYTRDLSICGFCYVQCCPGPSGPRKLRVWSGGMGFCGLNLLLVPQEGAPRLSYRLSRCWVVRKRAGQGLKALSHQTSEIKSDSVTVLTPRIWIFPSNLKIISHQESKWMELLGCLKNHIQKLPWSMNKYFPEGKAAKTCNYSLMTRHPERVSLPAHNMLVNWAQTQLPENEAIALSTEQEISEFITSRIPWQSHQTLTAITEIYPHGLFSNLVAGETVCCLAALGELHLHPSSLSWTQDKQHH